MVKISKPVLLSIGMLFCLQGCNRQQDTFLQMQMCVIDQAGVAQFKSMMRTVAKSENATFIDGSAETAQTLKNIGADKSLKHDLGQHINVGIEVDGTIIVMGGNLGLPAFQVALGFGAGSDAIKAHRLSGRLIKAFSQRWHVETVPVGQGVQPMKTCAV